MLNFGDRSFQDFVLDAIGKDMYGGAYEFNGPSKANHLRAFWQVEDDYTVAKLLEALIEYGYEYRAFAAEPGPVEQCRLVIQRLCQASPVAEIDAIEAAKNEASFEILARQIKESIERNEPAAALDRLPRAPVLARRRTRLAATQPTPGTRPPFAQRG